MDNNKQLTRGSATLSIKYLLFAGLCFLFSNIISCQKKPEFSAIDESTQEAYLVLNGYLKRRGMQATKADLSVKESEVGYIFRWQSTDAEQLFEVIQKDSAWQIKAFTDSSHP
ncbi:hypothetical protein [Teredinibacter haidensis]|uniref:hypothetical protein n=1 Tax=Teredinibacter haidensis TaxID=2731755 RepID=UPI000948E51D|nr:hypothetical protein [Teredinibacter haidensis]